MVEELGVRASGKFSRLKVMTIDSNIYRIDEYDGCEDVEVPTDIAWVHING